MLLDRLKIGEKHRDKARYIEYYIIFDYIPSNGKYIKWRLIATARSD